MPLAENTAGETLVLNSLSQNGLLGGETHYQMLKLFLQSEQIILTRMGSSKAP